MDDHAPSPTPSPFDRLYLACDQEYAQRLAVARLLVMSHETRNAFARHWPRYSTAIPLGSRIEFIAVQGASDPAQVDVDDTLPYGVIRARFEIPHANFHSEFYWKAFAVLSVGER